MSDVSSFLDVAEDMIRDAGEISGKSRREVKPYLSFIARSLLKSASSMVEVSRLAQNGTQYEDREKYLSAEVKRVRGTLFSEARK